MDKYTILWLLFLFFPSRPSFAVSVKEGRRPACVSDSFAPWLTLIRYLHGHPLWIVIWLKLSVPVMSPQWTRCTSTGNQTVESGFRIWEKTRLHRRRGGHAGTAVVMLLMCFPKEWAQTVCRMASSPKKSNISVNTLSVRIIPNPNQWPRFLIPNFVSLSLTLFPVLESSYHVFINVEFRHINAASFRLFLYLCSSAPSTNLLFIRSDPWKWIKFDWKFWEEIKKNKKLNRHRHTHSHKHTLSLVVPLMLDLLRSCQCSASSHYSPSPHISLFIPLSSPLVVFHSVTHTHTLCSSPNPRWFTIPSVASPASPDPLGPANPLTRFLQPFLTVNHGYEPIENAGLPESAHRSRTKRKKNKYQSHFVESVRFEQQ